MMSCWIVTEDGLIGTENQCLGIASALGVTPNVKRIGLNQPWKTLSPWLGMESAATFSGDSLEPPWPDLLLSSGRKSIAAARYIKKASGGKTFVAQIQDPRISPSNFDLVAVPEHDPTRGDNVIVTQATPNRVTNEQLSKAREAFSDLLSPLPTPRVAVLIGGNSRAHQMTETIMTTLAKQLKQLAADGYGLMITASRRTGTENKALLSHYLQDTNAFIWDGTDENPYYGFLAWADYIIVTADSTSMISEALTTGKPTYMIGLDGGSARFDRFHKGLLNKGMLKRFKGTLEPYDYKKPNDAALVAQEIKKRMR